MLANDTNESIALNSSFFRAEASDLGESTTTKTLRFLGYAVLFLFGFFGNIMVIVAVRKPKMKNVTNILIANLALADLLVMVFNVPSVLAYAHLWQWHLGEALCKILPFLQGLTLNASVGTLIALAIDKYWHIVLYKRKKITLRQTCWIILFIWGCSTVIPFPLLLYCKILVFKINNINYVLCEEVWPNVASRLAFTSVIFLALYLIPLVILSCLYTITARFLKQLVFTTSTQESRKRAQQCIVRMLITMVILFALCWLPYHLVFLYIDVFQPIRNGPLVSAILFSQWLIYASSSCNPVVYAMMNLNFRNEFVNMLMSCKVRPKNQSTESNSTQPSSI